MKTTSDFSPNSAVISWLVGGLNYQIEHHLFPRVSHVHYPALSKIVKEKCEAFNLPYNCYSFNAAGCGFPFQIDTVTGQETGFN